jgi:hypothetical protein
MRHFHQLIKNMHVFIQNIVTIILIIFTYQKQQQKKLLIKMLVFDHL